MNVEAPEEAGEEVNQGASNVFPDPCLQEVRNEIEPLGQEEAPKDNAGCRLRSSSSLRTYVGCSPSPSPFPRYDLQHHHQQLQMMKQKALFTWIGLVLGLPILKFHPLAAATHSSELHRKHLQIKAKSNKKKKHKVKALKLPEDDLSDKDKSNEMPDQQIQLVSAHLVIAVARTIVHSTRQIMRPIGIKALFAEKERDRKRYEEEEILNFRKAIVDKCDC